MRESTNRIREMYLFKLEGMTKSVQTKRSGNLFGKLQKDW